ncbi:MAG: phenylphosphate carboxylase subunit alpha [Clostridia bacterium]|nr:MAG: phenylphosphate carboxylase subunit alpha [Clostridia bacterium]
MAFRDNREFFEALLRTGDGIRVAREVDWDLEMGAIVRRVCEMGGPAPLFESIRDYPGWRALGAPLATFRRLAVALGLPAHASVREISEVYIEKTRAPGPEPKLVSTGPCKENVVVGDEVDLFMLPAPMVHEGDGGRYLSTWHMVVSKDPDTAEVNWGMYRQMVIDEHTMVGPLLPVSDTGRVFHNKYKPKNKPMPFATVIGADPTSSIAAAAGVPWQEPVFASALSGEPVELVKCETVDLEVPATAEVVLEGEILPGKELPEGPFGEYPGYRTSLREPRTVYRVNAITYRNNPILPGANMGVPVDEGQLLRAFTLGLEARRILASQGLPVSEVFMPPCSAHHLMIVSVKSAVTNIAVQVAHALFGSKLAPWFYYVVVVDADVDIYNLEEVIHAICTGCHPGRGIRIYEDDIGSFATPFLSLEERRQGRGAKAVFDCTFPPDWDPKTELPIKVSFETNYPKEVKERVIANWKDYGFPQ